MFRRVLAATFGFGVLAAASLVAIRADTSRTTVSGDPARLERIRKAKMPRIDRPVMFDTPEADAICSALEVFPPDNPWNLVVEDWPTHPNSRAIVASVGADKPLRYNTDMGFVLVPPDQKRVDVKLVAYPDESDKGPYPVPDNVPIEGWPAYYLRTPGLKGVTLEDVQRDKLNEDGDRHAIVVDPTNRMLYEFYQMKKTDAGWQAACSRGVRPEVEQAAAGRVDVGGCGGAADLPGGGPLRRAEARGWSSTPCG